MRSRHWRACTTAADRCSRLPRRQWSGYCLRQLRQLELSRAQVASLSFSQGVYVRRALLSVPETAPTDNGRDRLLQQKQLFPARVRASCHFICRDMRTSHFRRRDFEGCGLKKKKNCFVIFGFVRTNRSFATEKRELTKKKLSAQLLAWKVLEVYPLN